jgi:RNA polymerase subunit RPABC4/transcription elongation factor Spt4
MENISNLIVTIVAVIGAITVALIGGLTIWTFRDIRSRSRDILVQILATVMVGVVPVAGILVYFMLRPKETLAEGYVRALEEESLLASIEHQEFCPSCGRRVDPDMVLCPTCHTKLRNACPNCHHAVHLSWDLCPYCGEPLQPEMPIVRKSPQRRMPAAGSQTSASLPQSPARTPSSAQMPSSANLPSSLPPAQAENENNGFTNMLDKVGGAIEGLVDRVNSRGGNGSTGDNHLPSDPANGTIKPIISREESLE